MTNTSSLSRRDMAKHLGTTVVGAAGATGLATGAVGQTRQSANTGPSTPPPPIPSLDVLAQQILASAAQAMPDDMQGQRALLVQSFASRLYPGDLRRQNAVILRVLAALSGPPSRPRPAPAFDRSTHFSKVLSRTTDPSDIAKDPGLADQAGFSAMIAVIGRAFDGTPQPDGKTNFEAIEGLDRYTGKDVTGSAPNSEPDKLHFTNPLSGLSFDLESLDPAAGYVREAPDFASQVTAAEMAEVYWMALLRDAPLAGLSEGGVDALPFREAMQALNVLK